jgi:hypothetical protein
MMTLAAAHRLRTIVLAVCSLGDALDVLELELQQGKYIFLFSKTSKLIIVPT